MSNSAPKSSTRHETLSHAFGGSSPAQPAQQLATKAEYENLIHRHDWHELRADPHCGPKTIVFYSGKYNANTCDLSPSYESAAGVNHGQTIDAYKVAQSQASVNRKYVVLGDTEVGRALAQAENEKRFTPQEMDDLWSQASREYARAAATQSSLDRTAILSFTRNANDNSVYKKSEWPELKSKAHIVYSDEIVLSDGRPPPGDKLQAEYLDKQGRWTMQ